MLWEEPNFFSTFSTQNTPYFSVGEHCGLQNTTCLYTLKMSSLCIYTVDGFLATSRYMYADCGVLSWVGDKCCPPFKRFWMVDGGGGISISLLPATAFFVYQKMGLPLIATSNPWVGQREKNCTRTLLFLLSLWSSPPSPPPPPFRSVPCGHF
jgi:hypothetical protein